MASKNKKKKTYIRCDNDFALLLNEEVQLVVSNIGCQVMNGIMSGATPAMIIYAIPEDDGTRTLQVDVYEGYQDALRAASFAKFKDEALLKKVLHKYKISRGD